jgi:hypothetical protein
LRDAAGEPKPGEGARAFAEGDAVEFAQGHSRLCQKAVHHGQRTLGVALGDGLVA